MKKLSPESVRQTMASIDKAFDELDAKAAKLRAKFRATQERCPHENVVNGECQDCHKEMVK